MRLLFCGTPAFAVPTLKHLLARSEFNVLAVISQPDRPRGRGHQLSVSPVMEVALAAHLPVHQPEKIRAPEVQDLLERLAPDIIVIIAYGQIIPARLLTIPRFGWINLHASLLPRYRGAAPINWAIAKGESVTGNTTMRIDAGMDTGEMLLRQELPIGPDETAPELAARLSTAGADLMFDTLRGLSTGRITPQPQDHSAATLAPMLNREDGLIDWKRPAQEIYNRMRAFTPWPGAYSEFRGQLCHLSGRAASKHMPDTVPGQILLEAGNVYAACGAATAFQVAHVKLEGRKQVSASEFANGARLQPGERFGKA